MARAASPVWIGLAAIGASAVMLGAAPTAKAADCGDLIHLKLADTAIDSATSIAAGAFSEIDAAGRADLPAFCRVVAHVRSAPDSDIAVEVWLPLDQWRGVFHGNGNGGFGGTLRSGYAGMAAGLRRGYAAATTDTGTAPATTLNGDLLIGHPRKWEDWGRLSTHVMTVTGKAIARAFYGADPRRAYFTGCSTGGQQGLIEAEDFPEDYDGVLVGAPVISRTWGHAAAVWDFQAANRLAGSRLSDAKLTLLNRAAIGACGTRGDGLAGDAFVADPIGCAFDPGVLACPGAASDGCLTPAEAATARAFYSGPTDRAGKATYYGWLAGSEAPGRSGWSFLQSPPNGEAAFDGLFKWVFGPGWDWRGFDIDRDMPKVDATLGVDLNGVTRGDLRRFHDRGGKLILFQGLADTLVAPGQTVAFYDRQARRLGGAETMRGFARLFLAPGMMHCGGGPGPNAFNAANGGAPPPPADTPNADLFLALSRWVEDGAPPSQVTATKYTDDLPGKGVALQRPLCAYPQKAWYRGAGPTNRADSFICAATFTKGAPS